MISVLGAEKLSLVEIEAFLAASDSVRFVGSSRTELYKWVERLALPSRVRASEAAAQGAFAGLRRAHDGVQPGAVHAADWRLCQGRADRAQALASAPFPAPLHPGRRGTAGLGRRRRTRRLSGPATRHILKREFEVYGKPRVRAVGQAVQRPSLQPAPQPALRPAPLREDPAHGSADRRTQKARAQRPARLSAHRHRASGRRRPKARESTTSTPSTRLRSGRWCWQLPAFQRPG